MMPGTIAECIIRIHDQRSVLTWLTSNDIDIRALKPLVHLFGNHDVHELCLCIFTDQRAIFLVLAPA